jgi:hypothetical protein
MMVKSLIEHVLNDIAKEYQPGTLAKMKQNKPAVWGKLLALENQINRAALERNYKNLKRGLASYKKLILSQVGR